MSTVESKQPETFFQPGQYQVTSGLNATRPALEVKNIPFAKQTKRKPLVETVGLFEIKSRPGDHLPDRSLSRSCPALSSQHRTTVANFDKYTTRPPIIAPKKPYHREEDPETDHAVHSHSMTHDEMEAAKVVWSKTRTAEKFSGVISREAHHRAHRSYGNDVALQRSKENLIRGPVSVELLDSVGDGPSQRPRVRTKDFNHMAAREAGEGRYKDNPPRGKDHSEALRFERGVRLGDGRAPAQTLSPQAVAISQRRRARVYSALEDGDREA